ncbi:MAG: hypothetical protein WCR52_20435 [Bacteroidota bacterium]
MTAVEELAFLKDYDALSLEEQAFVQAEMSRAEYDRLRALLCAGARLDADVKPPDALRAKLMTAMGKQVRPSRLRRVAGYKIPLWPVLGVLCVAAAGFWFYPQPAQPISPAPIEKVRIDTVYVDKIIWRERAVYRTKQQANTVQHVEPVAFMNPDFKKGIAIFDSFPAPFDLKTTGTSLADEPGLIDMFTK